MIVAFPQDPHARTDAGHPANFILTNIVGFKSISTLDERGTRACGSETVNLIFTHSDVTKSQTAAVLLLIYIQFRKLLLKVVNLGQIVDHDVHVFGMIVDVILVVILRGEKRV